MTSLMCLAVVVYFEARGEPLDGQFAVAEVVYNRVKDERYPNDVCGVVFQDSQFSFANSGLHKKLPIGASKQKRTAIFVAKELLDNGPVLGISSTHYHTKEVSPYWSDEFTLDGSIGDHVFYTNETKYR